MSAWDQYEGMYFFDPAMTIAEMVAAGLDWTRGGKVDIFEAGLPTRGWAPIVVATEEV